MNTILEEIRERIKDRMAILGVIRDDDEYANGQSVSLAIALRIIDEVEKEHPVPSDVQEAAEKAALHYDMGTEGVAYQDGYKDGMLAERERLMKEAVVIDTDITINGYTKRHIIHINPTDEHIQHLPRGEYKAIIIKKENKK